MRETVLRALTELDRWTRWQQQLRVEIERAASAADLAASDGVARRRQESLRGELEKVNRQVAYYQALAQDMKKQAGPARVSDLLRTLFQA